MFKKSNSKNLFMLFIVSISFIFILSSCGGDSPTGTLPVETFRVSSISPANNSTGISVTSQVVVTFDNDVDPSTISTASFQVSGVTGTVSTSGATATFTPVSEMTVGTVYTVTLASNIRRADSAATLNNVYTSTFTCVQSQGVPTASAGADMFFNTNETIVLDGSLSSEPGGLGLTYSWTQLSGPSAGLLSSEVAPSLTAINAITTLEFILSVSSQGGTSSPDTVMVMICEDKYNMTFVSPNGDDDNSGTREAPMLTIQAAIDATSGFGDIYIAEGTYNESITLANGVSLYGGFDADVWTRSDLATLTIIQGGQRAIYGNGATYLTLNGLTINAADGNASELNSIGVGLESCSNVIITNNIISAGAGYAGVNGANGTNGTNGENGANSTDAFGAGGTVGGNDGGNGGQKYITTLVYPFYIDCTNGIDGNGPAGVGGSRSVEQFIGIWSQAGDGTNGGDGSDGVDGNGANQVGTLENGTYKIANGVDGTSGISGGGGGGGGGASFDIFCSAGAGGGAGGTGASLGEAGQGGGSSLGILMSGICQVEINNCSITTQDGGNGGNGGNGATGASGGSGGTGMTGGVITHPGGDGGNGGKGGDSGAGGGGTGGYSVGIIHSSTSTLTHLNNIINVGAGGNAGTSAGNDGQNGIAGGITIVI